MPWTTKNPPSCAKNWLEIAQGVYAITNLANGQGTTYIGSTKQGFSTRWSQHIDKLDAGHHNNAHLQDSWNKYGDEAFGFCIIEIINDVSQLTLREQYWLDFYIGNDTPIYNQDLNVTTPPIGFNQTSEARKRNSIAIQAAHARGVYDNVYNEERNLRVARGIKESWTPKRKQCFADSQRGEKTNFAKLIDEKVINIRKIWSAGHYNQYEIAEMFSVTQATISRIVNRKIWIHLGGD